MCRRWRDLRLCGAWPAEARGYSGRHRAADGIEGDVVRMKGIFVVFEDDEAAWAAGSIRSECRESSEVGERMARKMRKRSSKYDNEGETMNKLMEMGKEAETIPSESMDGDARLSSPRHSVSAEARKVEVGTGTWNTNNGNGKTVGIPSIHWTPMACLLTLSADSAKAPAVKLPRRALEPGGSRAVPGAPTTSQGLPSRGHGVALFLALRQCRLLEDWKHQHTAKLSTSTSMAQR